jgi:hypothetical protein
MHADYSMIVCCYLEFYSFALQFLCAPLSLFVQVPFIEISQDFGTLVFILSFQDTNFTRL